MTPRGALIAGVVIALLIGGAFSAVPFFASLSQTESRRLEVAQVSLSSIPSENFVEVSWYGGREFLRRSSHLVVLAMPYRSGAYQLPDTTWDRTIIPCQRYSYSNNHFKCLEMHFSSEFPDSFLCYGEGRSQLSWLPDMNAPPY